MPIVVEDGTGLANSNSYVARADADTYFAERGITNWATMTAEDREEALIRATDFMSRYAWKGARITATQSLDWPRKGVYAHGFAVADNVVPQRVKNACMELAFRGASRPLAPDVIVDDTGRVPTKKIEKVGPIDEETTYGTRGSVATPDGHMFPQVDILIREYVLSGMGVYR